MFVQIFRQKNDSFATKAGTCWFSLRGKNADGRMTEIVPRGKDAISIFRKRIEELEKGLFEEMFEEIPLGARVFIQKRDSISSRAGTKFYMFSQISKDSMYQLDSKCEELIDVLDLSSAKLGDKEEFLKEWFDETEPEIFEPSPVPSPKKK